MRNSISKSIVAGGAGDVDGRNLGVRAMGWRWLSPGLFEPPSALDLSIFAEASVREAHSRGP